jgi:DNA topoisomerase-1
MGSYTIIVTEKPDAAQRIASALDLSGKAKRMEDSKVPYFVAKRDRDIIVVPALGHLYTIVEEKKGRNYYPVFSFKWVPKYMAEKGAGRIRIWLEIISKLAKEADTFIDACDYDIEGSVIGYCILKYACGNKENSSKRMKYSTLTREELEQSYACLLPHLDFPMIEAGLTRHEVDWLYGVNLSRALTTAVKKWSGQYTTLSTGRVQGPTLKFLVVREAAIRTFVPTPYWVIEAEVEIAGSSFVALYEKRIIETKRDADKIAADCREKYGRIERIDVKRFLLTPPTPFDLGTLQSEAYNLLGYTPMRTSNIAQRLYLDALTSYPRTSSQKLPRTINYEAILKNLNRLPEYRKPTAELLARRELKPQEGKKEDPAHPAIFPTGNLPERVLNLPERNIWSLIVRRFMAVFGEPSVKQKMKACITIDGHRFYLMGKQTIEAGWLRFYEPYVRSDEVHLPTIKEAQTISVRRIILEERFTKPPSRFNPGSLLRKMEEVGIGTKATRAGVIQTLYDRKYIREERMMVTDLGFEVLKVLRKYCPNVVSIRLTRELEERMNKIQMNNDKRADIVMNALETLRPVIEELKSREENLGEQLSNAVRQSKLEERTIGPCPVCGTGRLIVLYSRKTGKRFVGCTNYFKGQCKASFPLPQKGIVKPIGESCRGCGWPRVLVQTGRRRPWQLCFNPQCPLKEEKKRDLEMQNLR